MIIAKMLIICKETVLKGGGFVVKNVLNISREITICNIPLVSSIELHPFNGEQIMTILTLYAIKLNLGTSITHYV